MVSSHQSAMGEKKVSLHKENRSCKR